MRALRTRPLVLIVEDDPDVLLIVRVNLESSGFDTALAADGDTALRRIDVDAPDAVLLDLMLPIVDGWEVLAELTSREGGPPVVVCSARRGDHDVERAKRLGAADFLPKPFDLEQLVSSLARVTGLVLEVAPEPVSQPAPRSATDTAFGELGLDGPGL
jgi:DNA-binding response OmpR family regulator